MLLSKHCVHCVLSCWLRISSAIAYIERVKFNCRFSHSVVKSGVKRCRDFATASCKNFLDTNSRTSPLEQFYAFRFPRGTNSPNVIGHYCSLDRGAGRIGERCAIFELHHDADDRNIIRHHPGVRDFVRMVSRHQFDAWVRGPLNLLIPHFGLVVWTHRHNAGVSNLATTIEFESGGGVLLQKTNMDTIRLGSELRRRWLMAGQVPLLLNANSVGVDLLPRIPERTQIVIHAVDPLFGGAGNLFAMDCEITQDFTKVLFMTQLIAPYLWLAVQRLDSVTDAPKRSSQVVSRPTSAAGLSGREIEILDRVSRWHSRPRISIMGTYALVH